jgi:HD-GYP domain-containing protein (c-di-GMP phosphodiesterase class II)
MSTHPAEKSKPRRQRKSRPPVSVPMAEVLVPMSRALDIAEGHASGHNIRACLIGMRLGEAAGLSETQLADLYYALLLKDAGGSSNAALMSELFGGDDHRVKQRLKHIDWDDRRQLALESWRNAARGKTLRSKVGHFIGVARDAHPMRELIAMRSRRGADVASQIGLSEGTAEAIRSIDERWNGNGYPAQLRGDAIPLLSRISNIAQTIESYLTREGAESAETLLMAQRDQWFDPALADATAALLRDDQLRSSLISPEVQALVISLEPASQARRVDDDGLDAIALAFADIVDVKSPYTNGHSRRVADIARTVGAQLGFGVREGRKTYRAGLLHDLGILGVSNRILDKNGKLTKAERAEIEHHSVHTLEVLQRVSVFEDLAMTAALHHEKLDASGYPFGRNEEDIDTPSRVIAVAEVFISSIENRAHRTGVTVDQALEILNAQRGLWLDNQVIDALSASVEQKEPRDL